MKKKHVKEIRAFNRFYSKIIGLLDGHILNSGYSLPEVRIMFELYHSSGLTASDIIATLDIDKGYLSRILRRFKKTRLISKAISTSDKRSATIVLTAKGKKEFELLNAAANEQIATTFGHLSENDRDELIQKMIEIKAIVDRNRK